MTFILHRLSVSAAALLFAFLSLAANAQTQTDTVPTLPGSVVPLIGPGVLLHSNEKHQRCNGKELELFSCSLESGGFAAVCLSPQDLHTTNFEFQDNVGAYESHLISDLELGFVMGNAHAFNMIQRGKIASGFVTAFVSKGLYEGESGAVNLTVDGNTRMFYCASENVYVPALWIRDKNGNEFPVDKDSLIRQGIAKPMSDVPAWPEMPDNNLNREVE